MRPHVARAADTGELNQRTGRLHIFTGMDEIHETLDRLAGRDLAERLPRRPGQKEERYRHLLGGDEAAAPAAQPWAAADAAAETATSAPPSASPGLEERVAALEAARLRESLDRRDARAHDERPGRRRLPRPQRRPRDRASADSAVSVNAES